VKFAEAYIDPHAPLKCYDGNQHGETHGTHAVSLEKRHKISETDKHHDLNTAKGIVVISKIGTVLMVAISSTSTKQKDHQNLKPKQEHRCHLERLGNRESGRRGLLDFVHGDNRIARRVACRR